jgi:hypothetical protein
MSLVQRSDGSLMDVAQAATSELNDLRTELGVRLLKLPPEGDLHRWISQEIEIIEDELWARERKDDA